MYAWEKGFIRGALKNPSRSIIRTSGDSTYQIKNIWRFVFFWHSNFVIIIFGESPSLDEKEIEGTYSGASEGQSL